MLPGLAACVGRPVRRWVSLLWSPVLAKRTSKRSTSASRPAGEPPIGDYRHTDARRKNNPPAKIAAEGTVPAIPRIQYAYNPHLPPVLRFDQTGRADGPETRLSDAAAARVVDLLRQAEQRPLSPAETTELQGIVHEAAHARVAAEPWLEWTGKRERKSFEVDPVALHIHERVSAQAILKVAARQDVQRSLFADPQQEYQEAVQFYRHDVDWANRLILGDSLQVMSSLARREDLAGKVQMIYMDPPYGIKFASNFQPEVGRRDVKDKESDLTREPEMVRAYRDTWHLGIHSYLSYLRDRLIVAKELLADTGSIFVQISDENVHRVRSLLDEVFGADHFCGEIAYVKTSGLTKAFLPDQFDVLLWYARDTAKAKYYPVFRDKNIELGTATNYGWLDLSNGQRRGMTRTERESGTLPLGASVYKPDNITSTPNPAVRFEFDGREYAQRWKTNPAGLARLKEADRLHKAENSLQYIRRIEDFPAIPVTKLWDDTSTGNFTDEKLYVVQSGTKAVARCIHMTTDPGDLVLDPTCGSGTTAYVAEQWGRRWITVDTSRVAVAIARQRLLTAKFDYYRVKATGNGQQATADTPTPGLPLLEEGGSASPSRGFLYKSVPHITLKSIAQNTALDPIFAKHEPLLDAALAACNKALGQVSPDLRALLASKLARRQREEGKRAVTDADRRRWLMPPDNRDDARGEHAAAVKAKRPSRYTVDLDSKQWYHWEVPFDTDPDWPKPLQEAVTAYRKAWRAKMDEVNACIAATAEHEELVDQPEVVRGVTRVTGPFTVEAVQPPEMTLGDNIDGYTGGSGFQPETPTQDARTTTGPRGQDAHATPGGRGQDVRTASGDHGQDARATREGLFAGAPSALPQGFEPRTLRVVEPRGELEVANVTAYLDTMLRYLRADGVRFLNNKQMRWTRLEPLFESGRASGFHAEGRWTPAASASSSQAEAEEDGPNNVAVVIGPQYGPVTAKMAEEAIRSAARAGYDDLVIAGFSFDGAATGIVSETDGAVSRRGGGQVRVHFAHIRPDVNPGMNGLLKESPQPGSAQLFTVFGLPRVTVRGPGPKGSTGDIAAGEPPEGEYTVTMEGVDVYNPVTDEVVSTGADKVAAWLLDSDYDGRTFCITQAFFPDRSAWDKLARALNGKDGPIDAERFEAFSGTTSLPFPAGTHRCVAVKVIDPRGNEVMSVLKL